MTKLDIDQTMQAAFRQFQAGKLSEAEALCQRVLGARPDHDAALNLLGLIANQAGRESAAVELIGRAIFIRPQAAVYHANLSDVLRRLGKFNEALSAATTAAHLSPDSAEAQINLACAYSSLQRHDEAVAACMRAVKLQPKDPRAYFNLGNIFAARGNYTEAIDAFHGAIQLEPDYVQAISNLGGALFDAGDIEQAITVCLAALKLDPRLASAHFNLANALRNKGQVDPAIASYTTAIQLNPSHADAWGNLANVLRETGRIDQALGHYDRAMAINPKNPMFLSNRLQAIHLHPDFDAQKILAEHRQWDVRHAAHLPRAANYPNDPATDRRLRIGYVSPDFSANPIGRFMLPLLSEHDRSKFEVVCYSDLRNPDVMTRRLQGLADLWRETRRLSDEQLAAQIAQDQIDILVDLTMHTADNRLLVFARKPVPIQVTYLAYASTTGLSAIDYRLTDPYLDPPGQGDANYSEKSFRLPRTFYCYQLDVFDVHPNPLPAATTGRVTFGCLNNFGKMSLPAMALWGQILKSVPNSRLILHAREGSHRQAALGFFAAQGIDPARISFMGYLRNVDYFLAYHQIDIALDPFPCAGGTTTCDALWMGVPVVSLIGKTAIGRTGLSILSNIGLPELAAESKERYHQIAFELASDLNRLAALRSTLRQKIQQSPLGDAKSFARDVEAAYRQMWAAWTEQSR
ncbi:MAG: tetratricopeptide repeat protein [Tepidisphaeraceae bacterium]|jgi:predicted O-linked N-acetylglucosamine transferase (SPINDLY family)